MNLLMIIRAQMNQRMKTYQNRISQRNRKTIPRLLPQSPVIVKNPRILLRKILRLIQLHWIRLHPLRTLIIFHYLLKKIPLARKPVTAKAQLILPSQMKSPKIHHQNKLPQKRNRLLKMRPILRLMILPRPLILKCRLQHPNLFLSHCNMLLQIRILLFLNLSQFQLPQVQYQVK